jgi:hypothetical protein
MICTWTGIANDVKKHLQVAHDDLCEDYNDQYLLLLPRFNAPRDSFKILFAYKEIFCYRFLIKRRIMHMVLNYIGPAKNDSKYQYKVMVMNNEETEGIVVTNTARQFTETEDDEFFLENSLKLHRVQTEPFRNKEGKLPILIKILKVDD